MHCSHCGTHFQWTSVQPDHGAEHSVVDRVGQEAVKRYGQYKCQITDLDNSMLLHDFGYYGRDVSYMQKLQSALYEGNTELEAEYDFLFEQIDKFIIRTDQNRFSYPFFLLTNSRYVCPSDSGQFAHII